MIIRPSFAAKVRYWLKEKWAIRTHRRIARSQPLRRLERDDG